MDLQHSFLEYAKEKYGQTGNAVFLAGDFSDSGLPETDYTLACGALSYHSDVENYTQKAIAKLFVSSRIGFGFNMLGDTSFRDRTLRSYDAEEILNYCKSITTNLIFKNRYYDEDFTVLMYK